VARKFLKRCFFPHFRTDIRNSQHRLRFTKYLFPIDKKKYKLKKLREYNEVNTTILIRLILSERKSVLDALREALYSATTAAATALLAKPRESNFKFAAISRPGIVAGKVKSEVVAASSAWFISSVT
jgi:hypothetical protein